MLKNYLTVAMRTLGRQMMYSFINIAGLAVGMACSLVIFLYVYGEWAHDKHFANSDRIYRIGISFFNMGNFAVANENTVVFLPQEFEGVEKITTLDRDNALIKVGEKIYKDQVYNADSLFFKVFSYEFSQGNAKTALTAPFSAAITESMAIKYFSTLDVIGKQFEVGKEKQVYTIAAVVKDDARPSHLKAKVWLARQIEPEKHPHWTSASLYCYVLLKKNVKQQELTAALNRLVEKQVFPTSGVQMGKKTLEEYLSDPNAVKFFDQPLKDIYLKSKLSFELSPGGNETYMFVFAVIAVFILVLAAVNFINLSTARAARRAKEVGIRKTLGTTRSKLISQFLMESMMISFVSMIIALGLAELFTFVFFWITGQSLQVSIWSNVTGVLGVIAFTAVVGLLSGVYPAFYLTSFQPAKVLKGNLQVSRSSGFRNGLVIFQFAISICLIICTAVIIRQLQFISGKELGFNQANVLVIENIDELGNSAVTLREETLKQPDVINASLHSGQPGSKAILSITIFQTPEMQNGLTMQTYFTDHRYMDVMGMKLVAGRNFNPDLASDTAAVIFNETAIRALNIDGDPIGHTINGTSKIIGVVSDFHWESLRSEIAPLAMVYRADNKKDLKYFQFGIKLKSANAEQVLGKTKALWGQLNPESEFQYHFLDENFRELARKEEVFGKAIAFFTILAILISCLGLFGLAAYTTEQRTKEIGIRKVLGASVTNIVVMLNKQFGKLVLISLLFAVPASYYAAQQWLQEFAYRIDLSAWIFLTGAIIGLLVSVITVAFHSVRASHTNPAETLKCE